MTAELEKLVAWMRANGVLVYRDNDIELQLDAHPPEPKRDTEAPPVSPEEVQRSREDAAKREEEMYEKILYAAV